MEIILVVGAIAFLIWLVARSRPSVTKVPTSSVRRTRPHVTSISAADTSFSSSRTVCANDCWVPPGRNVIVAGYSIAGGMLYVGTGLSSISGVQIEPALIDTSLPVKRSYPDRSGSGMTYWPSYSSISPQCRAAYLEWLAQGRRDPNAYIGYVFLYFYGLERRALAEIPKSEIAKPDLPWIVSEVEDLLRIYSSNNSFRGYATQFLDILHTIDAKNLVDPPLERVSYELPISVRAGIGRIIADGQPLPPNWALSWFLTHPETSIRTSMRRCAREFNELFCIRYAKEFGEGLRLKPNRSKLNISITPASASFGGQHQIPIDLPDIAALTAPLSKIRQIGDYCATDLDAFSRWVGRNPDASKTIAAVALLPRELVTTHDSQEAQALWQWVEKSIHDREVAVCKADDLLCHCASFGAGKLAKSEAVLVAQLLEKGGYGIEPDVRFGGPPLGPGGAVVLFRLLPGASPIATPKYTAATVLLHLAVAVSAADGAISEAEEQHVKEHLERALGLDNAECLRLSAHLAWLMKLPLSLAGLRKRLDPLDQGQRSAIADFIIGVAGADGHISPEEIRMLGKIYPMLGLEAKDVYSHVHAMTAGAVPPMQGVEPVTVMPAQASSGYAIPSPPTQTGVELNMAAVSAKLAESAKISAILDDIFTEDEQGRTETPSIPQVSGKWPQAAGQLLTRLAERPEWSRAEFERMAADCRLLPDGAIDLLNEAAFDQVGGPVIEGNDPIQVDIAAAKEMLT